jgi:hypothetical protein
VDEGHETTVIPLFEASDAIRTNLQMKQPLQHHPQQFIRSQPLQSPGFSLSATANIITRFSSLDIANFNLRPGQVLRTGVSLIEASVGSGIISLRVDDTITLHTGTAGSDSSNQQILNLMTMPQWPGIEQATAVLKLPGSNNSTRSNDQADRLFRILLNKPAASSYDLSRDSGQHEHQKYQQHQQQHQQQYQPPRDLNLPLIIDRHVDAIQQDQQQHRQRTITTTINTTGHSTHSSSRKRPVDLEIRRPPHKPWRSPAQRPPVSTSDYLAPSRSSSCPYKIGKLEDYD